MVTVELYKKFLLCVFSAVEVLNQNYGPQWLQLKELSKYANMDDYTEILNDIYEKYKNVKPIEFTPEMKLAFKIVLEIITYHYSQYLFGPGNFRPDIRDMLNVVVPIKN